MMSIVVPLIWLATARQPTLAERSAAVLARCVCLSNWDLRAKAASYGVADASWPPVLGGDPALGTFTKEQWRATMSPRAPLDSTAAWLAERGIWPAGYSVTPTIVIHSRK